MICTYIFKKEEDIYLQFKPHKTKKSSSSWRASEKLPKKHNSLFTGDMTNMRFIGMIVSAHSETLANAVYECLSRTRSRESVSEPFNKSVFIEAKVLGQHAEENNEYPSSFDINPKYVKPILASNGEYTVSDGEETGYYMASVVHIASPYSKDFYDYQSIGKHLYSPVVENALDYNNVTYTRYKPSISIYHTPIYYDMSRLQSPDDSDYKYYHRGFEIVCDNNIWEGEETGFSEPVNCILPDKYMPLTYIMPNETVRKIKEAAMQKPWDYDQFSISNFNIYINQELNKRVVAMLNHLFGRVLG